MKDIDFLPEWYKSGKRRQIAYRTQYVILGGMFVLMTVWNFVVGHSVSKAEAQVKQMAARQLQVDGASQQFIELKNKITTLREKVNTIDKIDSKVDVAAVIGELSYLIDESIVLLKLDMVSEAFQKENGNKQQGTSGSVLRTIKSTGVGAWDVPIGDVRFKLIIGGIAANGSDVMSLVSKLESSNYFSHVGLSFSRGSKVQIGDLQYNKTIGEIDIRSIDSTSRIKSITVSEFEISCYIANYQED